MKSWGTALSKIRPGEFKFKVLVDTIIHEIETGKLVDGQRLPPQRKVADDLNIGIQTITNVYKELKRQGLIRGETGRGSFVTRRATDNVNYDILDQQQQTMLDFSNACLIRNAEQEKAWRDTCLQLSQEQFQPWIHTFRPIAGLEPHRQAATQWLKEKTGLDVETKSLLITNGCAEAIDLALSSLAGPNDLVLCERLTDHGVIGMSQVLGFKLKGLEIDEHGIIPDHFEELCDDQKVTALVCTPNLNNPTGAIMPEHRRRQIAEIAARYNVYIIEDDVYGALLSQQQRPRPIATWAPDLTFYCTSFTKTVLTGLRIGYLVMPPKLALRTESILRVTSWMASPILAEIASRWVMDGTANHLIEGQKKLISKRQALVRKYFAKYLSGGSPQALSCWINIPEHWQPDHLTAELRKRQVAVSSSSPFSADKTAITHAIRVCIGVDCSDAQFEQGLLTIYDLFNQYPQIQPADVV